MAHSLKLEAFNVRQKDVTFFSHQDVACWKVELIEKMRNDEHDWVGTSFSLHIAHPNTDVV
jgi:hypothetical protein